MIHLHHLRRRAELLDQTRAFFKRRGFLEIETPLASREAIPEQHIRLQRLADEERWLQASPEMHHKRLLCAGIGPIFEITKSFRGHEWGRRHNPEFTMLEWYRPGDSLDAAIGLTGELLTELLDAPAPKLTTYRDAFHSVLGIDPHKACAEGLRQTACDRRPPPPEASPDPFDEMDSGEVDDWLNYHLSFEVEPTLGLEAPEVMHDYPASQAALATTRADDRGVEVAERFELYWRGVELANGYHELTDPVELRERLERANEQRLAAGWPAVPMPERLLTAMTEEGLPPCAGVALGFDRLVMLATDAPNLGEVVAFSEYY